MIDILVVHQLIKDQFPKWKDLPIEPVASGGWDNRIFRLGDSMLIRMPSASEYADQVEKEQIWLPRLASHLTLPIPVPIAMGKPGNGYLFKWSIYPWLEGESAASAFITDLTEFALSLSQFLIALQKIDAMGGPLPGPHSFYRGGPLITYDEQTKQALFILKGKIDTKKAEEVWQEALKTNWKASPVWVHGDISAGNLLVWKGKLSAVIDFGQLTVGDPACDLSIAWTLFNDESRKAFIESLSFDEETWVRARAWTLWKALIIQSGLSKNNTVEGKKAFEIIDQVLT